MNEQERERKQQAYRIWLEEVIKEKLPKAKTYAELHQVLELTVGNPKYSEINREVSEKLLEIAYNFREYLEAFQIVHNECKKIAFEKVSELADGFEDWFVIYRSASEDSKEQEIAFEKMKKANGSFDQWKKVRGWATYETKYGKAAFQQMKNTANSLTEKCKVWELCLGYPAKWF